VNSQPVLFIQGAGSMHEPEGSGRLAAYLARELGTDYRLIAPEMPNADDPHYQRDPGPDGLRDAAVLDASTSSADIEAP
jgi:hypothetical protein